MFNKEWYLLKADLEDKVADSYVDSKQWDKAMEHMMKAEYARRDADHAEK